MALLWCCSGACNNSKNAAAHSSYDYIIDKYWRLVEINGTTVTPQMWNREPHLRLQVTENTVVGNSGCNAYFGSYALKGGDRVEFSNIGATKMACPNMDIESRLFKALEATGNLVLVNDTLHMKDAGGALLARFVESVVK